MDRMIKNRRIFFGKMEYKMIKNGSIKFKRIR